MDGRKRIGGGDEQDLGEVVVQLQEVVVEGGVLLRIQDLK